MRKKNGILRHTTIGLILTGLLALPVVWAGIDEGVVAYEKGDYAEALREFQLLAEQGHIFGQYILGSMYSKGQGVPQDYTEAIKWYRKAAEMAKPVVNSNSAICTIMV